MYFEPAKKTYYRFPSTRSVDELDNRMYFSEKPAHTTSDSHNNHLTNAYMQENESRTDI
ncbi:MAG: hypothetical protein GX319_01090 [Clostridiales bacterium]|jgi:hypothetical protein|nr:hypothetical protein [Bacillota bacterium]NLK02984.1 hypothetical protein [Clostridiales bacterium]